MLSLIVKNQDHTVEWYYASIPNENYLIQYLTFTDEELSTKTASILNIYQNTQIVEDVEDLYGIHDNEDNFDYILNCDFHNFFIESGINIPKCFAKTISPKRHINNLDLLKFNNYFMSKGLRYKALKPLITSFSQLKLIYLNNNQVSQNFNNWKLFYTIFTSLVVQPNQNTMDFNAAVDLNLRGLQFQTSRHIYTIYDIFLDFLKKLSNVLPIFSFYIYKIDKRIYKNTRGKSGKYTFIWKYVAPYKRLYLVFFWLVRELKVSSGRSYKDRMYSVLHNFFFSLNKTWIFRIKKFSHNYVYKNCRLTLADNYITSKK